MYDLQLAAVRVLLLVPSVALVAFIWPLPTSHAFQPFYSLFRGGARHSPWKVASCNIGHGYGLQGYARLDGNRYAAGPDEPPIPIDTALSNNSNSRGNHSIASAAQITDRRRASNGHLISRSYVTPDLISHLKASIPLTSAIESYNLPQYRRTSPTRATALCPFHDDSNPSLYVDDERGLYKCFACGAGGDIFNFVREYKKVAEGGAEMSFRDAVQFVNYEFGDGRVMVNADTNGVQQWKGNQDKKETKASKIRKERLALANAAAADYYGRCLASLPEAGGTRSHLRSRGIRPETVRRFALGYAPDAYFGRQSARRGKRRRWGEGSLVERLREMKFTAAEVVEAGLASRIGTGKDARRGKGSGRDNAANTTAAGVHTSTSTAESELNATSTDDEGKIKNCDEDDDEGFASLMDRFRARLVVPIFDPDGTTVIGFGGRHIDATSSADEDQANRGRHADGRKKSYTPAKYLNSPESPIFSKKTVLFGAHAAKKAIEKKREEVAKATLGSAPLAANLSEPATPLAVVVVEGYFE